MKKILSKAKWFLLIAGPLSLVGCMTSVKNPIYVNDYKQSLQSEAIDIEQAGISAEWVGERFSSVMNHFQSPDVVERAENVFAPKFYFNDTWHTHGTPQELGDYLKRTGEKVHNIDVLIDDVVVSKTNAYIRWNMSITVDKNDEPINSVGMTHLRFNADKEIVTYQDYWDGIEGFYRTLPVLGGILEIIRKRLG